MEDSFPYKTPGCLASLGSSYDPLQSNNRLERRSFSDEAVEISASFPVPKAKQATLTAKLQKPICFS